MIQGNIKKIDNLRYTQYDYYINVSQSGRKTNRFWSRIATTICNGLEYKSLVHNCEESKSGLSYKEKLQILQKVIS